MSNTKFIISSSMIGLVLMVGATAPLSIAGATAFDDFGLVQRQVAGYFSGGANKRNAPQKPAKPMAPISLMALQKAVKVAAGSSTEKLRKELMAFIVERVNLHGINFSFGGEEELTLRQAGATEALLAVLHQKARERALHIEEQHWYARAQSHQPEVFQAFLEQYPDSRFAEAARARLESLHWERIESSTNADDFVQFISAYPNSDKVSVAQLQIETLAWQRAQAGGLDQDFAEYLTTYPQGKFADSARQRRAQLVWEEIKHSHQTESFMAFIEQYPHGALADAARIRIEQLRWEATISSGKQKDFEAYLQQYPQGHFAAAARERIDRMVNPNKYAKKYETETSNKPLRVSEEELREVLVYEVKPKPLSNASHDKTVKVRVVLSENGTIKSTEFAGGSRSLSASALMLVQQWKFRAIKRYDLGVVAEGTLTLQFPANASEDN